MEVYCHKNRHKVMSKDDLRVIVLHLMVMIFFLQIAFYVLELKIENACTFYHPVFNQ